MIKNLFQKYMTNNAICGMIFLGHGEYSIIEFLFVEF